MLHSFLASISNSVKTQLIVLLILVVSVPLVMALLDTDAVLEEEEGYTLPIISLSLSTTGFGLLFLLCLYHPEWMQLNPVSFAQISVFAIAWIIGSATPSVVVRIIMYVASFYFLVHTQHIVDTRALWLRFISTRPQNYAEVTVSAVAGCLFLVGSMTGLNLLQSQGQLRTHLLLTGTVIFGLMLSNLANLLFTFL